MISVNIFSFTINTKVTTEGWDYGEIEERNNTYPGMLASTYEEILLKAVSRYSGTLEDDEVIQCINDLKEFNSCSHTDEDGWNSFTVEINDVLTVAV